MVSKSDSGKRAPKASLTEAIGASPDYAVAHLRLGFSLVANRRYEEASVSLAKAFTLDPQIPQ